jgi:hypothetical protein
MLESRRSRRPTVDEDVAAALQELRDRKTGAYSRVPLRPGQAGWARTNTTSRGNDWVLDPDREGSEGFDGYVTVPRPVGAAPVLNDHTPGFHRYHYEDDLPGAERLPEWVVREILRRNAAPNDWLKPATREGANNDAALPLPLNQVVSYERTSNDGQYWVVNATRSPRGRGSGADFEPGLHVLSDGWVASTLRKNPDGTLSVLTYGEGNSPIQDPDTDLGRNIGDPVNDTVWAWRANNMRRDIDEAVRGGPRHWERFRRRPPPQQRDIRRDENGNFLLR